MIIREASKKDFEAVVNLENICFKDPYPLKHLEYEFEDNPLNKILVAEVDGLVVGFIDFMITFNSATIIQVCVAPKYRNKGIGSVLLKEMEKSFPNDIEDIVENVTLEVRKSNIEAISLYKKLGYELIVEKKHYYPDGEDALYMVKRMMLCQ